LTAGEQDAEPLKRALADTAEEEVSRFVDELALVESIPFGRVVIVGMESGGCGLKSKYNCCLYLPGVGSYNQRCRHEALAGRSYPQHYR